MALPPFDCAVGDASGVLTDVVLTLIERIDGRHPAHCRRAGVHVASSTFRRITAPAGVGRQLQVARRSFW